MIVEEKESLPGTVIPQWISYSVSFAAAVTSRRYNIRHTSYYSFNKKGSDSQHFAAKQAVNFERLSVKSSSTTGRIRSI